MEGKARSISEMITEAVNRVVNKYDAGRSLWA